MKGKNLYVKYSKWANFSTLKACHSFFFPQASYANMLLNVQNSRQRLAMQNSPDITGKVWIILRSLTHKHFYVAQFHKTNKCHLIAADLPKLSCDFQTLQMFATHQKNSPASLF